MRRSIPTLLLVSAALAVTACGEYSTTEPLPSANTALGPSFAGYSVQGSDDQGLGAASLVPGAPTIQQVTFSQDGGTIDFGGLFTLTYRQKSVSLCDDGGTECVDLKGSVSAIATFGLDVHGAPYIDIGTTLPGTQNPAGKHVYFANPGARLSTSFYAGNWQSIVGSRHSLSLVFTPTLGVVNEPNAPKSHFDAVGNLWRWVPHFTGYSVQACSTDPNDPSYDPNCQSMM